MPKVIGVDGKVLRQEATPKIFSGEMVGSHTVYRAVFRELSNKRAGTASTLRRDEVSGGGRKPWKQKGTGRARQGSTRSPQWRHGGVVFGPKPRSFAVSLNKKERKAAFIAALADRYNSDRVELLDLASVKIIKTADFAKLIFGDRRAGDSSVKALIVYARGEAGSIGLERAGRNLKSTKIVASDSLDISAVLGHERLVITAEAHAALLAKVEG